MNAHRSQVLRCFSVATVLAVLTWGCFAAVELMARASNCGGNSAALSYARMVMLEFKYGGGDATQFEAAKLSPDATSKLTRMMSRVDGWTGGATFLVQTNYQFTAEGERRELVLVCNKAFGNVPKPSAFNLWRQNLAHVAGYSDGTVELISPKQFASLDLSRFTDVRQYQAQHTANK
jgi:hypothetical protein